MASCASILTVFWINTINVGSELIASIVDVFYHFQFQLDLTPLFKQIIPNRSRTNYANQGLLILQADLHIFA